MMDAAAVEEENDENESLAANMRDSNIRDSIIHTATDFYHLVRYFEFHVVAFRIQTQTSHL